MKRQVFIPVAMTLAIAFATPACAQVVRGGPSYGYSSAAEVRRLAYERGYREGVREGERDGRRRDPFRYQDSRTFQRADLGYNRSFGDVDRYRQSFRSGYADGYTDGYSRYGRPYYGGGRYDDRRYGGYPQGRDAYVTAFDVGAREGYEKGREDARANRRLDPRSHRWYREGDRHYENRYGSRERYKDEYRRGFIAGYERGYREARW